MLKAAVFVLSKYRRFRTIPQIPHKIAARLLLRRVLWKKIGIFNLCVNKIHQFLAAVHLTAHHQTVKFPILRHRDTAVIEQVGIAAFIHASVGI